MVKIGCCGFPVGRRQYMARLPVAEVQQTFYQPPQLATVRRWRAEAPPSFEFTLKAWQLITHEAVSPAYRRLKRPLTPEERVQAGFFKDTPLLVKEALDKLHSLTRLTIGWGNLIFKEYGYKDLTVTPAPWKEGQSCGA